MFRVRWWWFSFGISAALGQQKMCFCCFRNGPGHKGCSMFYHSSKLLWHLSSIILQIFGQQLNIITKLIRCLVRNMFKHVHSNHYISLRAEIIMIPVAVT